MPVLSHRLTVVPAAFFAMKFASRSSFINLAMRSKRKIPGDLLELARAGRTVFRES